jgi:hypothetical protein
LEHSNEIKEICGALAKSQAEFPSFEKGKTVDVTTKTGGKYSYSYTDLGSIVEKTKKILSQNGIAVTQGLDLNKEDGAVITTMLVHISGEWFKYVLTLPIVQEFKNVIQAAGSAFTYGRRYALAAALGIASEADDDVNGAGDSSKFPPKSTPAPAKQGAPAAAKTNNPKLAAIMNVLKTHFGKIPAIGIKEYRPIALHIFSFISKKAIADPNQLTEAELSSIKLSVSDANNINALIAEYIEKRDNKQEAK